MLILVNIFVAIFGLIIGSFLNAMIYRLKFGGSVIFGRSKCPYCKKTLGFWDLIPVLSFIFLRGKCRYCNKKISWQYPAVEIATALLFILILNLKSQILNFGHLTSSIYYLTSIIYLLFVVCCLIVIFIYDLKYSLILDKVLLFATIGSAMFYVVLSFLDKNFFSPWRLIYGLAAGGGFFLILYLVSRGRWVGAGDVKFGFLMGFWLSYPQIFVGLFFAFVLGGITAVILLLAGKKKMKSQIPFGPFLTVGTLIALLFGQEILDWYLGWLGVY